MSDHHAWNRRTTCRSSGRHIAPGPTRTRRGFTQVELLVTVVIIVTIVSLILPLFGRARETARGSQCKDHLHNLAIAAHGYHYTFGIFPPGVLATTSPIRSETGGDGLSWLARILPFVEQKPLYNTLDLAAPVERQPPAAIRAAINIFLCPSDRSRDANADMGSNYAGCHHHIEAPIDSGNHGAFILGRGLPAVDFPDGLSHALLIGEKAIPPDDRGWLSGSRATLRNTGAALHRFDFRNPSLADAANPLAVGSFSSAHRYGVHMAGGDGAVRLLGWNVALVVLQRLADRADGDLISATDLSPELFTRTPTPLGGP